MSLQQPSPNDMETLPAVDSQKTLAHSGHEPNTEPVPSDSLSEDVADQPAEPKFESIDVDTDRSNDEDAKYPGPLALTLLLLGTCFAAFLVALDRTIVATAIPRITDDFNSPGEIGWYGSAYLLTSCAFQPIYGRVFIHFDVRWSFLVALGLFELGSLVCGAAPTSNALIVGRAIAGLGCAGIFAGCLVIISLSVPLRKRAIYTAMVGSIFGIGAVCGPVIGGAFTSNVSWRWCFYFNLPVGVVTVVALLMFFHPPTKAQQKKSFMQRVFSLDLIGNLLLITAVIMLLLALQFGGTTYAWKSAQIIGLLIGAGLETLVFIAWQRYRGPDALIPLKLISQRTVAASLGTSFFVSGAMLVHSYYIPYWFQAVLNRTPTRAGVDMIPYLASNFFFAMIAGIFVTKTGYYNPPALVGPVIASIGSVLIITFTLNTSTAKWAGYQVLAGGGIGLVIQQGIVAVQAVLPTDLIPIGTALIVFSQSLAGAIFVSVGSSLLRNELSSGLVQAQLPDLNVTAVLAAGATNVRSLVPEHQLVPFLTIYNSALQKVFIMAVPLAAMSLLTALAMEWRSLKGKSILGGGE